MAITHRSHEAEREPVGSLRVAEYDPESGDVVVPDELTLVDLSDGGSTLSDEEFGAVPASEADERLVLEDALLPEPTVGGPMEHLEPDSRVIRELLDNSGLPRGVQVGVNAVGDVVVIDPRDHIVPEPFRPTTRSEQRRENTREVCDLLSSHGYPELAATFDRLGVGYVSASDLSLPAFYEGVSSAQYVAYLLALTSFNGTLRIASMDAPSDEKEVFTKVYAVYLDGWSRDDTPPLITEARSRILSGAGVISIDPRWHETTVWNKMRAVAQKKVGDSIVTLSNGIPVLYDPTGNQE